MYVPTHKLSEIKWNLIWQPLMCLLYMALVLLWMGTMDDSNQMLWAAGASSLASSAYCVFAVPRSVVAHPLRIILAYIIACAIGIILHFVLKHFYGIVHVHDGLTNMHFFWITASLSVFISMVAMIFAGAQHPPSAGMSLVMVMDVHASHTLWVIWAAIIALVLLRILLRNKLKNLLE